MARIFTIGFTKTRAEDFFTRLKKSGAKKLIDVRLNNISQLAGFAKRDDLPFFLRSLCGMSYEHRIDLAPTARMLDDYKKEGGAWREFEKEFIGLLRAREVEKRFSGALDGACLLCSEHQPHHCHRRLVAEYLREHSGELEIVHL